MYTIILLAFSIALTSYLAVTSVYYGGPALGKGTAKAISATIISQGQQISGMAQLYYSDTGQRATVLQQLVAYEYLATIPAVPAAVGSSWVLDSSNNVLAVTTSNDISEICLEVERARDGSITELTQLAGAPETTEQFGCLWGDDGSTNGIYLIYYSL